MRRRLAALASIAVVPAIVVPATAVAASGPEPRPSPVAIVLDTSGSMSEGDGSSSGLVKIDGAKIALLDFLQQVEPNTQIGLRNYPAEGEASESEEGCSRGKAQFEVKARDPADMAARIRTLRADGDTPTAAALRASADELEDLGATQGTIVLVSDGESNCGRDPCDVAGEIAESGIDLQTITVGFRVSGAGARELQCIADQTGGKYLSVHDNEGLAEVFDEISRPKIRLTVNYPSRVTAQVGNDPSGLVRIETTLSNTGQRLARGVVARIRFDVATGAPAVIRPVVYLGNLDPGASREVVWTFRPGVPTRGRSHRVPFTVLGGAQNTLADTEFDAEIEVRDAYYSADAAGPILGERRDIAIAGDSYSAGEGGDLYLEGTDTDANACHRSRYTYLFQVFALADEAIVACSGGVANDVFFPQKDRGVGSQSRQLTDLRDRSGIESVVLTLGGNDVGFAQVAQSCLIGRSSCAKRIYTDVPLPQRHGEPADRFRDERLRRLLPALEAAYREINWVVNGPDARALGGPVPILVLAYPLATPLTPKDCPEMYDLLAPEEFDYINDLALRLNGTVERAAANVRAKGAPVFFVPNTEMAFQPDHTVCHSGSFARTIFSFNGAAPAPGQPVDGSDAGFWNRIRELNPVDVLKEKLGEAGLALKRFQRGAQELLHPNQAGYAAMTRAVLRWSQSPDAMAAVRFLESAPEAQPYVATIQSSGDDLGQLLPGSSPILQGGTTYPLNLQGFGPESTVTIGVHSEFQVLGRVTASDDGDLSTRVGIPPNLDPGDHTLIVAGTDASGEPRTVEIPFRIAGGGLPTEVVALIWGGAVGGVVSLLLVLALLLATRIRNRRGRLR